MKSSLKFFICLISFSLLIFGNTSKIPLIIDTDLGPDIDDVYAILYILNLRELFDLKMILTCQQNTTRHAQIIAKFLTESENDEIPIGIGIETEYNSTETTGAGPLYKWAQNFSLNIYKGKVFNDGIGKAIEIIESSEQPIYILAIGPLTNIYEIIFRKPHLSSKIRIHMMGGSIYQGVHGEKRIAEYNIKMNITAAQNVFMTHFNSEIHVHPLDTCSYIQLTGDMYKQLFHQIEDCKGLKVLLEAYQNWYENGGYKYSEYSEYPYHPLNSTSALFDVQPALELTYSILGKGLTYFDPENIKLTIDKEGWSIVSEDINTPNKVVFCKFKNNELRKQLKNLEYDIVRTLTSKCNSRPFYIEE
jgi:inosine-uridine nucleoside N-ribohydrolase